MCVTTNIYKILRDIINKYTLPMDVIRSDISTTPSNLTYKCFPTAAG